MNFTPYDPQCYDRLFERFEYVFEPELIKEICKYGRMKSFDPETTLMDIGDDITHMPLVVSGAIKVFTEDEEGHELILYFLELGDTCAVTLNCCTRKSKSNVRAIAEVHSEVLFIPVDRLEEWMVRFKSWRAFVLDSYNTRMNEMLQAIDTIVFHSMEDRIVKYLKDKAWATKSEHLNVSHADIASELHSSRVVVSRIMKKLELNKVISQQRGKVTLLDL